MIPKRNSLERTIHRMYHGHEISLSLSSSAEILVNSPYTSLFLMTRTSMPHLDLCTHSQTLHLFPH